MAYSESTLNTSVVTPTADELSALQNLCAGVDAPGLGSKLGATRLFLLQERVGSISSGATGKARFFQGKPWQVEAVYVQADAMVANITANVLVNGVSKTDTGSAVGLDESLTKAQRISLATDGITFSAAPESEAAIDVAGTEGLEVQVIADGSGSVTSCRVYVFGYYL